MQSVSTRGRRLGRALALLLSAATSGSALSCASISVAQARDGLLDGALSSFSSIRKPSRAQVLTSGDGTYIGRLLDDRDSVLDRWPDRIGEPIRVWIEPLANPADATLFPAAVVSAFDTWAALGIPVRFRFVQSESDAEVRVRWVSSLANRTGSTTWRASRDGWLQSGDVTLATHMSSGGAIDARGMRAIALHEIGHVLGLSHSDRPHDVMAPLVRVTDPSTVDSATVRLLYTFPAGRVR